MDTRADIMYARLNSWFNKQNPILKGTLCLIGIPLLILGVVILIPLLPFIRAGDGVYCLLSGPGE